MDSSFDDSLAVLGVLVGGFVVVVGLGTLLGLPWTSTDSTAAAAAQMVGIVVTIAIGLLLVFLTYADDPGEALS
jgi:uridylate kinase